mmetsp:Transcript_92640/g.293835  ORF Transcript_92640/g.293835 Transcript_92640/m.293835 type:complete len:227 (+) Transcript_92640:376-1056(+)
MLEDELSRLSEREAYGHRRPGRAVPVVVVVPGLGLAPVAVDVDPAVHEAHVEREEEPRHDRGEGVRTHELVAEDLEVPPAAVQPQHVSALLDFGQQLLGEGPITRRAAEGRDVHAAAACQELRVQWQALREGWTGHSPPQRAAARHRGVRVPRGAQADRPPQPVPAQAVTWQDAARGGRPRSQARQEPHALEAADVQQQGRGERPRGRHRPPCASTCPPPPPHHSP